MNDVTARPNSLPWPPIHLSGGDRRQRLFKCFLSTPVVRAAAVRYPLCDRLVDDRRIRRPEHFSRPCDALCRNDCEAGSRYGSPRHGRPLLLHTQSALPRQARYLYWGLDWSQGSYGFCCLPSSLPSRCKSSPSRGRKGISRRDSGRPMRITPGVCGG
jgi:hypothetical protein